MRAHDLSGFVARDLSGFKLSPQREAKRMRRIGIVALARRLAIAVWRYLEHGVIPAGATLKPIAG